MTESTQPERTLPRSPARPRSEVPAPTAPPAEQLRAADLPRNLVRLTAQAEVAGWTASVQTQPGHCALLLTAPQDSGVIVLRCVWQLTARGYRWDGATLTRYGQTAAEGIAWRGVRDVVTAEAPAACTVPGAPDLSMSVYGKRNASPVTAEVVSAHVAATPAGEVPVMLRPWTEAAVPLTLYPSRFVGRGYVGADCLLSPGGDDAAPGAEPVLSVLPAGYLVSNAVYLEDLAAYAVEEGRTQAEGGEFARWVVSSGHLTLGVYDGVYALWVRSLTCTMTAAYAVLSYTPMNGAALGLTCGCGQRHPGRPWERATVWNEEGCHYPSSSAVDLDRVADLIAARGYRVAGAWSAGDVIRRVAVEPTAPTAAETAPVAAAAADAGPCDPGSVEAWESDGEACPGTGPSRGPEPGPAATPSPQEPGPSDGAPAAPPLAPSAHEVARLPKKARTLVETATANGWDVSVASLPSQGPDVRAVTLSGQFPVSTGTQAFSAQCVWDGARYWGSVSRHNGHTGAAFRDVLAWVRDVRAVSRVDEASGRTVWGRDAAEWHRQLGNVHIKMGEMAVEARFAHGELTGAAADRAQRGYRAHMGEDARPLAAERDAMADAVRRVRAALEQIKDAPRAVEAETLAVEAIAEAERQLTAEEEDWRTRLAAEGKQPTASEYGALVQMLEAPGRAWVIWHAAHGRAGESFHEAYDRWVEERHGKGHRHAYTRAYLNAHLAQDAARAALAVAVGTAVGGEEGRALVEHARDRRSSSRRWVYEWLFRARQVRGRFEEFAAQHPAEVETLRVAELTVAGVEAYARAEREAWEAQRANADADTPS
ncbi:hypothetical protein AB0G67_47220 [Streptomyces sp. NPDC021056]|uniref:hypothetical protein n=1 Tax=Streptomyces sp. NPDC021056 TaxID=3155012 RepID=UPI0034075317